MTAELLHPPSRTARSLAVISDFHLGRPDAELACQVPTDEILAAIDGLQERADLVIVNGDLFDLERGTLPLPNRELSLLREVHARILNRLIDPGIAITRGNHDRVLGRDGTAFDALDVELPFGTFRVEHGDRFDGWIKQSDTFTSLVTWTSGRVHRVRALRPIYDAMRFADRVLTGAAKSHEDPVAQRAAAWLASSPRHRGMVIGHTHHALLRDIGDGRLLMNPGDCMDTIRALVLDDGTASLARWDGSQLEEVDRRAV